MHQPNRTKFLAAIAAVATLATAACSSPEATINSPVASSPHDAVALLVAVHQHVAAPAVPAELAPHIDQAVANGAAFHVVGIDGTPTIDTTIANYEITDVNSDATADDKRKVASRVVEAVEALEADSNGSDILQSLRVAADKMNANNATNPLYIIIDSGFSDTGALNMTAEGMSLASPDEISTALQAKDLIPDLEGSTVLLTGFGYTVAPQPNLATAQTTNITNIWHSILETAGATVEPISVPRNSNGPDTAHTTATVPPAAEPDINVGAPTIYADGSSLGFLPDRTDFRDSAASAATLDELAAHLDANPDQSIHIMGTTAGTGTVESQVDLATRRADVVRDGLVVRGIDHTRITTEGAGTQWPGYTPDVLPDGTLDPAAASQNRTVQITFTTA